MFILIKLSLGVGPLMFSAKIPKGVLCRKDSYRAWLP